MNPLTPPDCDLRDFPRMMIDISRLRQSSFDATPDDAAWRAGLNLWFSAWHSVPAGSLEDDEAVLAKAAGLGRDLRTWRKLKAAALRGFTPCDDGRLYHETVCELALESWIEKLTQRLASGAGNARRWGTEFDPATIERAIEDALSRLSDIAPESKYLQKARRRQSRPPPAGNPTGTKKPSHRDEKTVPSGSQETGTGTGNLFGEADASLSPGATEDRTPKYPDLFEAAWQAYRHVKGRSSKKLTFAQWKRLPAATRQALPAAARRYSREGREPNEPCGAQAMERWLRDEKFADWMEAGAASGPLGADWPESRWAAAVAIWRQDGSWEDRLGPKPNEPGCRAPASLIIRPTHSRSAA